MSCDIRKYKSCELGDDYSSDMTLTAFVGKPEERNSVQFTINGKYCALSENAVKDLIEVLQKRLNCEEGFSATDSERDDIEFKG